MKEVLPDIRIRCVVGGKQKDKDIKQLFFYKKKGKLC